MDRAAEAGVPQAHQFFSMTPRQVFWLLTAWRARLRREEEQLVLFSRLEALAYHAPDRLPPLPPDPAFSREMSPDEIKQRLLAWRGKEMTDDIG